MLVFDGLNALLSVDCSSRWGPSQESFIQYKSRLSDRRTTIEKLTQRGAKISNVVLKSN